MILLILSSIVIVVAIAVRLFHTRAIRATIATQRARLTARIEPAKATMSFEGDALDGFELRGSFHDVAMFLSSQTTVQLPGPSGKQRLCGIVKFDANIRDLLVSRLSDVDTLMGPIPGVVRTTTGSPSFDASYGMFVAPNNGETVASFRSTPAADALVWAKPDILRECIDQGLLWFRVRDGHCQFVRKPMGPGDAHSALALCANIALAVAGKSLLEMPAKAQPEHMIADPVPLLFIGLASAVLAPLVGGALTLITPLSVREQASLSALGLPPDLHIADCMVAGWAVVLLAWVLVSLVRWTRGHRFLRHWQDGYLRS